MQKIIIFIILIAIIGCKKDNKDNDSIIPTDPIAKDSSINYPESGNGGLNLLKLASGTEVEPDTSYSITAFLGKNAILKIILTDPSPTGISNWIIDEESNTGWTISAYENGQQQLISSDSGLINLNIKFNNTGYCNIQTFENQLSVSNQSIQLHWATVLIPQAKYILAGIVDSLNYHFYDYLVRFDEDIYLDINEDGQDDMYLFSYYEYWNGGAMTWSQPYIKSLVAFEILADTSEKASTYRKIIKVNDSIIYDSTQIRYDRYKIPKILELNDTIDGQGIWIKDNDLIFSYYSRNSYWEYENDTTWHSDYRFQGWNDLGYKYLGYRFISQGDTLYGWLNLKHSVETYFNIKDTSYK